MRREMNDMAMRPDDLDAAMLDWLADDPDPVTRRELLELGDSGDPAELADRFSHLVDFGTSGLRAPMGAGPNRMNVAVVTRAAAGVAAWVTKGRASRGLSGPATVVVGFDARHRSDDFARVTAEVLAAAGVTVKMMPDVSPTPMLAFAVVDLGADAGVMVTASHNPAGDNGYKVFDHSGHQIVSPADRDIRRVMGGLPSASDVPRVDLTDERVELVDDAVVDRYVAAALELVDHPPAAELTVAYTALHGVAGELFGRVLAEAGHRRVQPVEEQAQPDPDFPTVAFPNPEEGAALARVVALASGIAADVALAHDPDGDRLAVVVPARSAGASSDAVVEWRQLRGDEIGALLAHQLIARNRVRPGDVMASSVVSSALLGKVAAAAGVAHRRTLTGFKWISRAAGPDERLVMAYEEALGFYVGGAAPDKDGITSALVLLELVADQAAAGRNILDVLDDLAVTHGVHQTGQVVRRQAGPGGTGRIAAAMESLRVRPPGWFGEAKVVAVSDLAHGDPDAGLAPANVITYALDGGRVVIRPSGTEPKLKCYAEVYEPVQSRDGLHRAEFRASERLGALLTAVSEVVDSLL